MRNLKRVRYLFYSVFLLHFCVFSQWQGLEDKSTMLQTNRYTFLTGHPEAKTGNKNYYAGDFADFNNDGWPDRALGSRYGLLRNTGEGFMDHMGGPTRVNYLHRGDPGNSNINGEDAMQWSDVNNDGYLDILQGGNSEIFSCQINNRGRFHYEWGEPGSVASALQIVNTDLEKDGDVDLVVMHAFCSDGPCGGPVKFSLWVNDGTGHYTEESQARNLFLRDSFVVGAVSGDIDNDGDYDLIIQVGASFGLTISKNNGSGQFTNTKEFLAGGKPLTGSGFNDNISLGDVDDDGDLDIFMTTGPYVATGGISHILLLNDGTGDFSDVSSGRFSLGGFDPTGKYMNDAVVGDNSKLVDIDYDGDLDALAFDKSGKLFSVCLNDGSGNFTFSTTHSIENVYPEANSDLGAELDITDLDFDGTYDVWLGIAAADVRILINKYKRPDGKPADQPRNVNLVSASNGEIKISWEHPEFVTNARHYKIYRSIAPGLHKMDKELIKIVGQRHQDEAFADPITRHTTTAYLNDPDIVLDGASNKVTFTDKGATPGIKYYYSIAHIGAENHESAPSTEIEVTLSAQGGSDSKKPDLKILSPVSNDWGAMPRIVVQYGDGQSGIDASSLNISFNKSLGGNWSAGYNLNSIALIKTGNLFITSLLPGMTLPQGNATMTVSIKDAAGNEATAAVSYDVSIATNTPADAQFTMSDNSGTAPFTVNLEAVDSTDSDGKMLYLEWYFSDGTTAFGRKIDKTFTVSGINTVTLLTRDSQGTVDTLSQTVDITGGTTLTQSDYDGNTKSFLSVKPNPANPDVNLMFSFLGEGFQNANLKIYNSRGVLVDVLNLNANQKQIQWSPKNAQGKDLSSGLYFAVLNKGIQQLKQSFLILK